MISPKSFKWHTTFKKCTWSLKETLLSLQRKNPALHSVEYLILDSPDGSESFLPALPPWFRYKEFCVSSSPSQGKPNELWRQVLFPPLLNLRGPVSPFLHLVLMDWAIGTVYTCFPFSLGLFPKGVLGHTSDLQIKDRIGRSCFKDQMQSWKVVYKMKFGWSDHTSYRQIAISKLLDFVIVTLQLFIFSHP